MLLEKAGQPFGAHPFAARAEDVAKKQDFHGLVPKNVG
jgi:hypothetical protein